MRLCPWADVVYGCDGPWWQNKNGLPGFRGTKLCHDSNVCANYRNIHKIEVCDHDKMLFDEPGVIGSGGNSGFQALNIAVQFGATRILLIGFDMHAANGVHWYGPNTGRDMRNPLDHNYVNWRNALNKQSRVLRAMGIEVINASRDSALVCFEHKSIVETLEAWDSGDVESAQVDMDWIRQQASRGGGVRGRTKLDPKALDAADPDHGVGVG